MKGHVYAIVLPVFNEAEHLRDMVTEIRSLGYSNIIVIDGYSDDGSVEIAYALGVTVLFRDNPGKGSAIKKALEFCYSLGIERLLVVDCDSTYSVSPVPMMLKLLDDNDLVVGARNINLVRSFFRRLGNHVVKLLLFGRYGVWMPDPLSGLKALRVNSFYGKLISDDFVADVEVCLISLSNDYSFTSVNAPFKSRAESKLSALAGALNLIKLLRLLSFK